MRDDHETNQVRAQAQNLLRGEMLGNALVVASGHVEMPLEVQAPDGQRHSWFVPVTVGNQLAGFFQFLADGTFMRFSSLQHRPSDLAGCPAAADWLDPKRIQARAEVQRQPDETSSKPFLTYDRTPDRLVWAVPLTNASGDVRLVYVAGKTVYLPPPGETYG
jgi:hypothetical protein